VQKLKSAESFISMALGIDCCLGLGTKQRRKVKRERDHVSGENML